MLANIILRGNSPYPNAPCMAHLLTLYFIPPTECQFCPENSPYEADMGNKCMYIYIHIYVKINT
jgi:hypothetical protein